jgi:nucleotide-binding universal stress UspA family protein
VKQPYRDPRTESARPKLERLLVATLLDPTSLGHLPIVATLARATGGSVRLLHVLEALMYSSPEMTALAKRDPNTHPEASRKMAEAVRRLTELGLTDVQGSIEFGIPGDVILEQANSGAFDLLVLSHRGRGGGVYARALAESKIPVMSLPYFLS